MDRRTTAGFAATALLVALATAVAVDALGQPAWDDPRWYLVVGLAVAYWLLAVRWAGRWDVE